jgi:hypothetical protein
MVLKGKEIRIFLYSLSYSSWDHQRERERERDEQERERERDEQERERETSLNSLGTSPHDTWRGGHIFEKSKYHFLFTSLDSSVTGPNGTSIFQNMSASPLHLRPSPPPPLSPPSTHPRPMLYRPLHHRKQRWQVKRGDQRGNYFSKVPSL